MQIVSSWKYTKEAEPVLSFDTNYCVLTNYHYNLHFVHLKNNSQLFFLLNHGVLYGSALMMSIS